MMKWRWVTKEEKSKRKREYRGTWHRKFVIWPRYDLDSRTAYCLCYVWRRAVGFESDSIYGSSYYTPARYEYRGGNNAPDVKTCPVGTTPTVVGPTRSGMTPPF